MAICVNIWSYTTICKHVLLFMSILWSYNGYSWLYIAIYNHICLYMATYGYIRELIKHGSLDRPTVAELYCAAHARRLGHDILGW